MDYRNLFEHNLLKNKEKVAITLLMKGWNYQSYAETIQDLINSGIVIENKDGFTIEDSVINMRSTDRKQIDWCNVSDTWNRFANEFNLKSVRSITARRKRHYRARLCEDEFNLNEIICYAKKQPFLKGKHWFTFDWITETQNNYPKVLELKYDFNEEKKVEKNTDLNLDI